MNEKTGEGTRKRDKEAAGGRRMKCSGRQRIAAKGRAGLRAGGRTPGLVPVELLNSLAGPGPRTPKKLSPSVKTKRERADTAKIEVNVGMHNTHIASSAY